MTAQIFKTLITSQNIGWELNFNNCEILCLNNEVYPLLEYFKSVAAGIKILNKKVWTLLESPFSEEALLNCVTQKSSRIQNLLSDVAFFIVMVRYSQLIIILRWSPTW